MLVLIKSFPETYEARTALRLAADMKADIAFLQNGVYHASKERLQGLPCTAYFMREDLQMRGLPDTEKAIGYHDLVDLMAEADKVVGLF